MLRIVTLIFIKLICLRCETFSRMHKNVRIFYYTNIWRNVIKCYCHKSTARLTAICFLPNPHNNKRESSAGTTRRQLLTNVAGHLRFRTFIIGDVRARIPRGRNSLFLPSVRWDLFYWVYSPTARSICSLLRHIQIL